MGAFKGPDNFYSMPPGNPEPDKPQNPVVENPPYPRYSDSGVDSFAPSPVTDPTFQPSDQSPAVVGPPPVSIPLIALGLGFLFWVLTRED